MKKLLVILGCILAVGCQEGKMMTYTDEARVQYAFETSDIPYSFIWLDKSQTEAVVKIPLKVIGGPMDADRQLKVVQVSEYTVEYTYDNKGYVTDSTVTKIENEAVPGVHYVAFDDPEAQALLKVKAGAVQDSVAVILKRDASLSSGKVRLRVQLEASDDFQLGESKFLARTIVFSDMLEQPSGWYWKSTYNYSTAYSYLGMYSVPKHELMIRVLQRLQGADSRVDDEWIAKGNSDPTIFVYWRAKFIEELNAFNENPENIASGAAPLREDPSNPNSALVSFPNKVN